MASGSSSLNSAQQAIGESKDVVRSAQQILQQLFGKPLPSPPLLLGTEAEKRTVTGWMRLFSARPGHFARPMGNSSPSSPIHVAPQPTEYFGGNGGVNYRSKDVDVVPSQNRPTSSGPSPVTPDLRRSPNAATVIKEMIQSRLSRVNRQLLAAFANFKKKTEGEMKERDDTIQSLTETVEACKAKILEMEHQKEDYIHRGSPLLKGLQQDLQNILFIFNSVVGTDPCSNQQQVQAPIGLVTSRQDGRRPEEESPGAFNGELLAKMRSLEEGMVSIESKLKRLQDVMISIEADKLKSLDDRTVRIEANLEAVLATCKSTEDNFKHYKMETREKLDQIAGMLMADRARNESSSWVSTESSQDIPPPVLSPAACFQESENFSINDEDVQNQNEDSPNTMLEEMHPPVLTPQFDESTSSACFQENENFSMDNAVASNTNLEEVEMHPPVLTPQFNESTSSACFQENENFNMDNADVQNEDAPIFIEEVEQEEELNTSDVNIPYVPDETVYGLDSVQSPPPVVFPLQQCSTPPQTNHGYEDTLGEQDEATNGVNQGGRIGAQNWNDASTTIGNPQVMELLEEGEFSDDDLMPVLSVPGEITYDSTAPSPTMPILLPEVALLGLEPRPYFQNHMDKSRNEKREIALKIKIKPRHFPLGLKGPKLKKKSPPKRISFSKSQPGNAEAQMASEGARRVVVGIRSEKESADLTLRHARDFLKPGFSCSCGSTFTGAGGLYVHLVKNMEYEKFSCDLCGRLFHYFSGLKAHRKTTHKMEFTAEVGCSRCGKVFHSKKNRQGHRDARGQTCWLSGSYQSKNWKIIRKKRVRSSSRGSSSSELSV